MYEECVAMSLLLHKNNAICLVKSNAWTLINFYGKIVSAYQQNNEQK
jgi:hypothetical protein